MSMLVRNIGETPGLLTAMAAKLACSARHISGFTPQAIKRDLQNYSPAFRLVRIRFDDKEVTASIAGSFRRTAYYRPGIGCHLKPAIETTLDEVQAPASHHRADSKRNSQRWPHGERTPDIHASLQCLTDQILAEDTANGRDTRALVIIHGQRLLAESYAAYVSPMTPLLGWSMAKSLTAILLGRMEALGLMNMDAHDLFPEWQHDRRSEITLRHLLQMCSGLEFDETYAPGSDATRMLFSSRDMSKFALQCPLIHSPGQTFAYSSGSTNLLTRWIHQRLGGTQQCIDFLHRELLQPLCMNNTLLETDTRGILVGSSYAFAPGRDWARLGLLMLNNGVSPSGKLLNEHWVQGAHANNTSSNEPGYGYQFWLNKNGERGYRFPSLPADAYFMLGNREQKLMITPSHDAVVLRIGWDSADYPMEASFSRILAHIAAI